MRSPSMGTEEDFERSGSSSGGQTSARALYKHRQNYGNAVNATGEVSEYKVAHLMTFTMERKEAILTVEDSIRKLQLLDARGKIWAQELIMTVDDTNIQLVDRQTLEILERFQLSYLQHVQPVINACVYNSICAMVVRESHHSPPDIHLFQCSNVPADVICADISSALADYRSKKEKRIRPDTLRRYRDTIEKANQLPTAPPNMRGRVAEWTIKAQNEFSPRASSGHSASSPEMMIFRIHRDVDMLNHALDDIEVFVSLLQKSAVATQELAQQRNRRKGSRNGGRQSGASFLEARARLPPSERFVDAFQKFRFCFNLLAKLKEQIKDPNAVELVHFLFQPLAMIIHSFCGFDIPRQIKSPLLHRDAILLIRNCATTQEIELLERLGDFWIKSRRDFPKEMYFPPYVPRFVSGWEPPPIPKMEVESRGFSAKAASQAKEVRRHEEDQWTNGRRVGERLPPPQSSMGHSHFTTEQSNAFKQHVQRHVARNQSFHEGPKKLGRALFGFSARSETELSIELDELLHVLEDTDSWWKVKNKNGEVGYVPDNVVLLLSHSSKPPSKPPPANPPPPEPIPAYVPPAKPTPAYVPPSPPPPNVVPTPPPAPISPPAPVTPPSPVTPPAPKLKPVPLYSHVQKPPVKNPPLKKPPVKNPPLPARNAVPLTPSMQDELRQRVANQNQRNFVLPKKNPVSTFLVIDRSSSTTDVFNWLRSLGFSELTVSSMGVLSGAQIFALTRDEIKQICGDDGPRVYSQLMIQRSMDGYATTNDKSELSKVLKKIRESISEQGEKLEGGGDSSSPDPSDVDQPDK